MWTVATKDHCLTGIKTGFRTQVLEDCKFYNLFCQETIQDRMWDLFLLLKTEL